MKTTGKTVRPLYLPPLYQEAADQGRIILRDGTTATIRISTNEDEGDLTAFFERLSPESHNKRFFTPKGTDENLIKSLSDSSDPKEVMTLIVIRASSKGELQIIASASYMALKDQCAEFAVAVEDKYHGRGLGTLLLERLAVLAAMHGFVRFSAHTMEDNLPMLEIFRNSGFKTHEDHDSGYVDIELSVLPSEESVRVTEMRDRVFTASSVRPFFKPRVVAVVGASSRVGSIGYRIIEGMLNQGYTGNVYAINPKAPVLKFESGKSITALSSCKDISENVDLAVIVVPRDAVLRAIDDCAHCGTRALVIISAGFAEASNEGRALQNQVVEKARGYGMRVIGPNCLGLINAHPDKNLNASFSPIFPPTGNIAMYSQSGALGLAILGLAKKMELGISNFASVGNKSDVSGNDLLQYWQEDPDTEVILIYLEAFNNPRRFARVAREVSRTKPIVCVKGGRTTAGKRAAGSHTAAMAGSDVPVEALFQQAGVIRADTLQEMFDLAATLSNQPLPAGRKVGVVTNAGGPGILCADTCESGGLVLPALSETVQASLATFLPEAASTTNPVDMIASAPPEHFKKTIHEVLSTNEIDSLIVIYIPVGTAKNDEVINAICEGVEAARADGATNKPVLVSPMFGDEDCPPLHTAYETLPVYAFPEAAAEVLTRITTYSEWRSQPPGIIPDFDNVKVPEARAICVQALKKRGAGWLTTEETRALLKHFLLPVADGGVAKTPDEAVQLAESVGYPVAAKLASHTLVHKTELGGVHLNLKNNIEVIEAFSSIHDRLTEEGKHEEMEGVLVQPMVKGGVEVMIGVTEDPLFGPLVAFGLGGIHVEIMSDVRFRVTPLTNRDASAMIRGIRGYKLLEGYRGHPPGDTKALEEILLRISLLVEEIPEIKELDLNPVYALSPGKGCQLVDARIRVEKYTTQNPARYTVSSGKYSDT